MRGWLKFFVTGLLLVGGTAGAEPLAGVAGGVGGVAAAPGLPGLRVPWQVRVVEGEVFLSAAWAGAELEVAARWPGSGRAGGAWRIVRGRVEVAEAWPEVRGWLGPAAGGWSASGVVELAGAGSFGSDGTPVGRVMVTLREGWAKAEAPEVEMSGIGAEVEVELSAEGWRVPAGQWLRVARVVAGGQEATGGEVIFGSGTDGIWRVERGGLELLGGRVEAGAFEVDLARPRAVVAALVRGVALRSLATYAPWLISTAEGVLSGEVELGWSAEGGATFLGGALRVERGGAAEMRLAPSPGLLSAGVPQRFLFLPRWLGKWTERVGPKNPMYDAVRAIELGEAGLRVEDLRLELKPEGGVAGRSATLRVRARPVGLELVEEVNLEVNFYGSLAEAIALGLDERVRIQVR